MVAVRVYGAHDYRLEEIPVPEIGPGEVLVRVLATGICASDVKTHAGARGSGAQDRSMQWRTGLVEEFGEAWGKTMKKSISNA